MFKNIYSTFSICLEYNLEADYAVDDFVSKLAVTISCVSDVKIYDLKQIAREIFML